MGRRLFCENKKRLFGAMAVMFLIMAALGAIGYVFRIFYRGPDGWSLVNPFMGLWFTLILILLALDLFAGALFGGRKPTACAILDYVYFSHCLICCLIIGISYIVYGRYDISFWCLCIGIVSGLSLAAVSSGQKGSSSRIGSGKVGQFLDESGSGGGLRIEDEMIREEGDGMSGWLTCALWTFFRVPVVILLILLCIGAVRHASLLCNQSEDPSYLELKLPGGRMQSVYYECEGTNKDFPVLLLGGGGINGGVAPFYGIRAAARENKYRVCTWDNPGNGLSDYLMAQQNSTEDLLPYLMEALKEKEKEMYGPKYIYVGWLGGGEAGYRYALENPDDMEGLVLLDTDKWDMEWRAKAIRDGIEDKDKIAETRIADINQRSKAFSMINAFPVPFGLLGIWSNYNKFDADYWSEDDQMKAGRYFTTEKVFITLWWNQDTLKTRTDDPFEKKISSRVPVHVISTQFSNENFDKEVCQKLEWPEEKCARRKAQHSLYQDEREKMAQNGGRVVRCEEEGCGPLYYTYRNPKYTLDNVVQMFS